MFMEKDAEGVTYSDYDKDERISKRKHKKNANKTQKIMCYHLWAH
jgi:hypothetical protein